MVHLKLISVFDMEYGLVTLYFNSGIKVSSTIYTKDFPVLINNFCKKIKQAFD